TKAPAAVSRAVGGTVSCLLGVRTGLPTKEWYSMRVFLIFVVIGWVLIGSISTSVSAQEPGSKKMIFGEGINSCGSWTQSQQTKSIYQGLSAQWVAGFLSGMNMQADVPNFLSGTDFNG